MISFLRGRQGPQGPTGATGSQGNSGNIFTTITVTPVATITTTTISALPVAPASGVVTFFGQISFDASALNLTTITPLINGVSLTGLVSKATTPLGQSNSITISGSGNITAGQPLAFNVTVTGGGNISITSGSVSYSIV